MKLSQNIIIAATNSNIFVEGLSTLVVGISVVFLALLALVVILTISGKFFEGIDKNKKAQSKPIEQVVVRPEPQVEKIEPQDDLELVAVITASIAASLGTSSDNFKVRSIRKTNNVWNMAGRKEQLYN